MNFKQTTELLHHSGAIPPFKYQIKWRNICFSFITPLLGNNTEAEATLEFFPSFYKMQ